MASLNLHPSLVTIVQVLDYSFCNASFVNVPPMLYMYPATPRFVLSATLMILAVFQTLKQSVEIYKATKQWHPNRYMQQLGRDGILYFLAYVPHIRPHRSLLSCPTRLPSTHTNTNDHSRNMLLQIAGVLTQGGTSTKTTSVLLLGACFSVFFYPLIPRFIISIRELYDRDLRGCQGVDSGCGVVSRSTASLDESMSGMIFMDVSLVRHGPAVEGDMGDSDAISHEMVREDMSLV